MRPLLPFINKYLMYVIIVLGVYLLFVDFSYLKMITADASTYLNIAENIRTDKGFTVSFNLYQYFKEIYYPLWAYMQPIYPLFCALFIEGGIISVIKANIVVLGVNTALIFYIVQSLAPTRLNVLFILWMLLTFKFYLGAIIPWTEHLHLFFFLVSFIGFLKFHKNHKWLLIIGILNGVLMLVRFAHFYNLVVFMLMIFYGGNFKDNAKRMLFFLGGFLAVFGSYEAFCFFKYNAFYPEYLQAATNYAKARSTDALIYDIHHVGILPAKDTSLSNKIWYLSEHIRDFISQLSIFSICVFFYFFLSVNKKKLHSFFILNCLLHSLFLIGGYSYSLCWYNSIDSLRYALIPFVLTSVAGWVCLYELFYNSGIKWKRLLVTGLIVLCAFISTEQYIKTRMSFLSHPRQYRPYFKDLFASYNWINQNLAKDALVASDEDQEGYFMHRPFISIPVGKSYTCQNLKVYHHIYSPEYYLLSRRISDECFKSIGYTEVFSTKNFRILKINSGESLP